MLEFHLCKQRTSIERNLSMCIDIVVYVHLHLHKAFSGRTGKKQLRQETGFLPLKPLCFLYAVYFMWLLSSFS